MPALDVMVMPSRHEGFGLAFIEAMAMGVPVVGTRVVGSVDAVQDGTTGLLVPPDDPAALAAAILRLFDDPQLRGRLVDEARPGCAPTVRERAWRGAPRRCTPL